MTDNLFFPYHFVKQTKLETKASEAHCDDLLIQINTRPCKMLKERTSSRLP